VEDATRAFGDSKGAFPGMLGLVHKSIPATLAKKQAVLFIDLPF